MPMQMKEIAAGGKGSDIFLHVQTKRAGKVKGESTTEGHADDIEIHAWGWGASAGSAIGSTAATARRQYRPLVVTKGIDSASTGLMAALATNDEVKEATLTMRKAGGEALDYYRLTLKKARVVSVEIDVDEQGHPVERVSFTFTAIDIEYKRQDGAGASAGSFTFSDEVLPS
jgi:type VI secretion system secreted protein Hcp